MAVVAPSADQAADMLQKSTLDSRSNTLEVPDASKRSFDSDKMATVVRTRRSTTPFLPDVTNRTVGYHPNGYHPNGCYYGDMSRFMSPDGMNSYGEGAPLMYHPSFSYSQYPPYSPSGSMVPTLAHDGQLYGTQQYQYPSPYFQSLAPNNGNSTGPSKGEFPRDSTTSKSNGNPNRSASKGNSNLLSRQGCVNSSVNINSSYAGASLPQEPRYSFNGINSPVSLFDSRYYSNGLITSSSMTTSIPNANSFSSYINQGTHSPMGLHNSRQMPAFNPPASGYMNRMYNNRLYYNYWSTYAYGNGYGSNNYALRTNGYGSKAVDCKYKPRARTNSGIFYGGESTDGLNELSRGPRTQSSKNLNGFTQVDSSNKVPSVGTNDNEKPITVPDRENYNRQDFPEEYSNAKFFVIKSYSEDDIHKSIKYNTWSSTENGNKKLDAAYQEAQQKTEACPVFLFFSVNTSGQFVGVAEMIGSVDFDTNIEYWQQDKWIGCFPVKWHIVKDVSNSFLKYIILQNNENKPVTNSRDTQEVELEQGLKILKIFKDHHCKQCVLDDFDFYEERQKRIQEKKSKLRQSQTQSLVSEFKPVEQNGTEKIHKAQDSIEDASKFAENSQLSNSGDITNTALETASANSDNTVAANGF